jgi:hypothetical protein
MTLISTPSEPDREKLKFFSGLGWVLITDLVFALIVIFPVIIDID